MTAQGRPEAGPAPPPAHSEPRPRSGLGSRPVGLAGYHERQAHGCTITVVVATRDGYEQLAPILDALVPQVDDVGGEVIVACGSGRGAPVGPPVTWLAVDDVNLLNLRRLAVARARGDIIAFGEDHLVPGPGWCAAVVRAHAEHPAAAAVVGCLANGTDRTVSGRANFLGFAAPFTSPMPILPTRPPPVSVLSFKRQALDGVDGNAGCIESALLPQLFREGRMVPDDRIVGLHYQDHGWRWSVANAFVNARANYGYSASALDPAGRRGVARWITTRMVPRQWREARAARHLSRGPGDLVLVAVINAATATGALTGTFAGPGRAAERVA